MKLSATAENFGQPRVKLSAIAETVMTTEMMDLLPFSLSEMWDLVHMMLLIAAQKYWDSCPMIIHFSFFLHKTQRAKSWAKPKLMTYATGNAFLPSLSDCCVRVRVRC